MDSDAFREWGKKMVDFVADNWESLPDRKPLPDVKPGYISELVPSNPPEKPEEWEAVFSDLEKVVMLANTNWHHPNFYAYFPTALSYPSIMADILSGGIAGIGFTWKSGPAMTELEMATLDWLVVALGLPDHFKNSDPGPGCGIIQSTASDATLIAFLSARARAVETLKAKSSPISNWVMQTDVAQKLKGLADKVKPAPKDDDVYLHPFHDPAYFDKLVAYCSDQAHSSVEKGAMLTGVRLRKLKSTRDVKLGNFTILPQTLEAAIKEDRARGLFPFILIATVGTTNTCGVDYVKDLGPICNQEGVWLHVDAAYAGSFLVCPHFRYLVEGIETVDSFNYNAHKAMMINFDCSPMWFKDACSAVKYFNVDPLYLKHEHQATAADYRHLQVALGRRFRSLKIWFVMRIIGIPKIQETLIRAVDLASLFARIIVSEGLFELYVPQHLGLVCFKMVNSTNEENEKLCNDINEDGRIHLVPAKVCDVFFLRLAVCSQLSREEHILHAYDVIKELAQRIRGEKTTNGLNH